MPIASVDPTTGKLIKSFSSISPAELERKLEEAWQAFHEYRHTSVADRAMLMKRAGQILDTEKESFASLMTAEMGKTFRAANEECGKCAWACRYIAESAE